MFSEYREHVDEPRDLVLSHVPPVISVRSGWWLTYPSEKWWLVSNSWDDDIPNMMGKS